MSPSEVDAGEALQLGLAFVGEMDQEAGSLLLPAARWVFWCNQTGEDVCCGDAEVVARASGYCRRSVFRWKASYRELAP